MKVEKKFKQLLNEDMTLALIIQLIFGLFSSGMHADTGFWYLFMINFSAYWAAFLCIFFRAKNKYTRGDLFYIKYGNLINIFLMYAIGLVVVGMLRKIN